MRRFRPIIIALLLVPLTGCAIFRRVHPYKGPQVITANLREATRDELIKSINDEAAKIQTIDATVDIAASTGGQKKNKVVDYTDIKGYILVREPNMLRMIGLAPFVRTKLFDMVSDAGRFKLSVVPTGKFYVGTDEVVKPSSNPLENLRPHVIFDALLLHSINEEKEPAFLEVGYEEVQQGKGKQIIERPDYELIVGAHDDKGWYLSRKVIFSRTDLQPHRQLIYDRLGNVATDARYDAFQTYDNVTFPSQIEINRPQEEYTITLKMMAVKINQPLRPEQFVLNQPPGSKLVPVGGAQSGNGASSGAPPQPKL